MDKNGFKDKIKNEFEEFKNNLTKSKENIRQGALIAATICGIAMAVHDTQPGESVILNLLRPKNTITQTIDANATATNEKCDLITTKTETIFNELQIEEQKGKTIQEQKQAADKILNYVVNTTRFNDSTDTERQKFDNQIDADIDSIYYTLCEGHNVNRMTSEGIALNYLFGACGIDSKLITIQQQFGKTYITREVISINFTDKETSEECICDPIHARTVKQNWRDPSIDSYFVPTETYFQKHVRKEKDKYSIKERDSVTIKQPIINGPEIGL